MRKYNTKTNEQIIKAFQEEFNIQERVLLIGFALVACLAADALDVTLEMMDDVANKIGLSSFDEADVVFLAHRLWNVTGWDNLGE